MREDYLQSVRSLLDCPKAERERLMAQLEGAVTAYLEDTAETAGSDLAAAFGTPEACAARLLAECDPGTMAGERRKKRHRTRLLLAFLAAVAVLAVCYALHMRATGGTAVIEHYHYVEGIPEDFPTEGEFRIEYNYDD